MWCWNKKSKTLMPSTEALTLSKKNKLIKLLEQQAKELDTLISYVNDQIEHGHTNLILSYITDYQKELLLNAGYKIKDESAWGYETYFDENGVALMYSRSRWVTVPKVEDVPKGNRAVFNARYVVSWDDK